LKAESGSDRREPRTDKGGRGPKSELPRFHKQNAFVLRRKDRIFVQPGQKILATLESTDRQAFWFAAERNNQESRSQSQEAPDVREAAPSRAPPLCTPRSATISTSTFQSHTTNTSSIQFRKRNQETFEGLHFSRKAALTCSPFSSLRVLFAKEIILIHHPDPGQKSGGAGKAPPDTAGASS
jgi:hypothetical protein